jgi:hypothetical protein
MTVNKEIHQQWDTSTYALLVLLARDDPRDSWVFQTPGCPSLHTTTILTSNCSSRRLTSREGQLLSKEYRTITVKSKLNDIGAS